MAAAAFPSTQTNTWSWPALEGLAISRSRIRALSLAALTIVAFGVRTVALSNYGLSDDEINKLNAIEQYRRGHFDANAEHPMLMKLAMWGSLELATAWNRLAGESQSTEPQSSQRTQRPAHTIAVESAIRLPNAVAGAATTVALFGLSEVLFGTGVAVMTSLFWAVDVNAVAINRIGKEDTFLLFFFVLGMWCYERGKREGVADPVGAQRWYGRSGVSFGLMLASKYMPHFLGIYAIFNMITDRSPGANRPGRLRHYGSMAVAFVTANLAVLMPGTWRYCLHYVQGSTLTHHGYPFAGHLYLTSVPVSPLGVPASFYPLLIATKVPIALAGAVVAGVIELVRRRNERGFILLRVWLLLFIVPYSLMAAKFIRYALPLFAALDIVAAVGVVAGVGWLLRKSWLSRPTRVTVACLGLVVSVAGPCLALQSAAPFYSLSRNAIGERLAAPDGLFPEATYDYGVREAVVAIADAATLCDAVVSDTPAVVRYYLEAEGRTDLEVRSLSAQGMPTDGRRAWVIVQNEHLTFENQDLVAELRQRSDPWREFHAGDAPAAQVFRLSGR